MIKWLPISVFVAACGSSPAPSAAPSSSEVAQRVEELTPELIELRRDIHAYPELAGEEARTAAVLAERLRALGLEVRTGIGGHGFSALLRGARPGRLIAYRAELDAVLGNEPPGREYGSKNEGAFHACGHDLHMAIAVGVASVLSPLRERLPGSVLFVFQPAEETWEGADRMLNDDVFLDATPDEIYALHSFPFEIGTVARDVAFAGLDRFEIELGSDVTEAEAEGVLGELNALGNVTVPRSAAQVKQYLSDLQVESGPFARALYVDIEREEETPSRIAGVLKAHSDAEYPVLRERVRALLDGALGAGRYSLAHADAPFPSMVSDTWVTEQASVALVESLGEANVVSLRAQHAFSGEDFARFLQHVPGAMFLLGVANADEGILGAPHFPDFDADERAIAIGTRAMSWLMVRRLTAPR